MIRPGKWSKWSFKTEGPNLCTEFVETVWGVICSSYEAYKQSLEIYFSELNDGT